MFIGIIIALAVLAFLFYASYRISAGFYLRSLCRNKMAEGVVALTFDDGVDPIITPKVLELLRQYKAKATFFIIGEKAALYPELVQEIVAQGHVIGNHSYYHKWSFPMQCTKAMCSEVQQCSVVLEQAAGVPIKLFRPPFGVTNPMVGRAVRKLGLISIGWSIRSLDTMGEEVEKVRSRVFNRIKSGEIILLHDNRANANVLLAKILCDMERKGLRGVTIYELFKIS